MRHSLRTFAAAVSIAAAGVGVSAGVASAAPVQLTEAAPIQNEGGDPGAVTGSADALLPLLSGSAGTANPGDTAASIQESVPATPVTPSTGSAESLGPLLEMLAAGSSGTQNPAD